MARQLEETISSITRSKHKHRVPQDTSCAALEALATRHPQLEKACLLAAPSLADKQAVARFLLSKVCWCTR